VSLPPVIVTLAAIGGMIPAYIALLFWKNPARGMGQATHRMEQLPLVMIDRYVAFALFAIAAALSGDMSIIAVTFAILAVPGLGDALIYARAGHSYYKHLAAGIGALLVSVAALSLAATSGAV